MNVFKKLGAVVALLVGGIAAANAALPAAIGTALTGVQEDGLALADLVWPIVIAIFGALLLMKLFKRFGTKI